MSRALILVVVANRDESRNFCYKLAADLREHDNIPTKWSATTPNIFQTPNVEVRFIVNEAEADGLLADAIYGPLECRKSLYPHLKIGRPKTPVYGLHDWIVKHELMMAAKTALNSAYGRGGIERTITYTDFNGVERTETYLYNLAKAASKVGTALAIANGPLKHLLPDYRKENTTMSISPYVMALANHQGPATIHAGGLSIPVKIMDIDSENHLFKPSETSIRCIVVNEHDICSAQSTAVLMREFVNGNTAPRMANRFAIKKVHFNDPVTVVIWEDGTKTIVRCQEGDVYSKETGLALCIAKKALGNKGNFNDVFHEWIPEEEEVPISKGLEDKGVRGLKFTDKKMVVYGDTVGTLAFTSSREDVEAVEQMIDNYVKEKANG